MMDVMLRFGKRAPEDLRREFEDAGEDIVIPHTRKGHAKRTDFFVGVSESADFAVQAQRVEDFLRKYSDKLRSYRDERGKGALLDFGVAPNNIGAFKQLTFEPGVLKMLAESGTSLAITVYGLLDPD